MLGLLDEADAPHRIAIVEPVAGVALTGRCQQAFPLVITQRIGADIRKRGELANRQHGMDSLSKGRSQTGRTQNLLVDSSVRAACGQLAVDDHRRDGTHAERLGALGDLAINMSSTTTSQDGQAALFTTSIAS